MQKECIKWCDWFQIFCKKNHVFPYATACSLSQFDKINKSYEILRRKITRKMIFLLNHLASLLYSLGSKFLILNVGQICKK
jgi:hypothetical protein